VLDTHTQGITCIRQLFKIPLARNCDCIACHQGKSLFIFYVAIVLLLLMPLHILLFLIDQPLIFKMPIYFYMYLGGKVPCLIMPHDDAELLINVAMYAASCSKATRRGGI